MPLPLPTPAAGSPPAPPDALRDAPPDTPPGYALVRALAPVVPAARRDDWTAEWHGELAWAWHEARRRRPPAPLARLHLYRRTLGAAADALWIRRRHGVAPMIGLDLRYAARALRRRPGFTSVVVLTLALGIGATTAIFSVVNGVLLRPLAFPEPERLVLVRNVALRGNAEKVGPGLSYPDYLDVRAQSTAFARLAATRGQPVTLTAAPAEPARVEANVVTPSFFPTMGVGPALGRGFRDDDARPGGEPTAILSHALWQRRYGGDPGAVGRRLTVDGVATTVVGVMPPDLRLLGETALWLPLVPGELERVRGVHRLTVVGRLRAGESLTHARAELRAVARRLAAQHPADNTDRGIGVEPLRDAIVGPTRTALLVLLGAVALVLVVGCTNLASLFLGRAASRGREMALRATLGATRGRIVRQWMTESLLLTVGGGLAGLLVAWLGMRALLAWVPRTIPRANEVALDLPVLGFLLGVSTLTGLLFGALPALHGRRRPAFAAALREGGRGATGGRGARRVRLALVCAELGMATMLVIGAGLLLKSFWGMQHADPGFRPDGVTVVPLQLPPSRFDSAAKVLRFYGRLRSEVASIPGVTAVSFAYAHPLSEGWTSSYALVGAAPVAPGTEPEARVRPVWPGYFRAVGVRLVRGRDVSERDDFGAPGVVVVNEAFVRRHFAPNENPIGRRLDGRSPWWPGQPTAFEIVGVVADEPFLGPGRAADGATYYPHAQFPMNDMWLVVHATADAAALAPALRERIWRVDPDLPVEAVRAMTDVLHESVAEPRFSAALLGAFAGAALLLAAVGVYGVLSYTVAQRTNEIGVRMALGAERARVVGQVVGEGLRLAGVGVGLGTLGAFAGARVLESLLVGVAGHDPAVFAAVAGVLVLVAGLAAWLPARRASRIDPVTALRYD